MFNVGLPATVGHVSLDVSVNSIFMKFCKDFTISPPPPPPPAKYRKIFIRKYCIDLVRKLDHVACNVFRVGFIYLEGRRN